MPLLQTRNAEVEALYARFQIISDVTERSSEALIVLREIRAALEAGRIRVAERIDGEWVVHSWIKQALLLHGRLGIPAAQPGNNGVDAA